MGLSSALQVGKSGLFASQTAVEVAGNNLANIGTRNYHRQSVNITPNGTTPVGPGLYVGNGVKIADITREVNQQLEARLRSAIADQSGSKITADLLTQIESIENELSGVDLSTELQDFFNAWSDLAGNPQDDSLRSLAVEQGRSLANFIRGLDEQYGRVQRQVNDSIYGAVGEVSNLLDQIETINNEISTQEAGQTEIGTLRDQRDGLLADLSKYLDISTSERNNGEVDIFVGSTAIMLDGKNLGVEVDNRVVNGEMKTLVVAGEEKQPLDVSAGEIGAMLAFRDENLAQSQSRLDTLASQLVWQVNRLHAQGHGESGFESVTGRYGVADATAPLSDADATALPFTPAHGSFKVHVTDKTTGQRTTTTINVDLDGINPASDTTLTSLVTDLDAVTGLSASITAGGQLRLDADDDFTFGFSDDRAGALAALGVNSYFTGSDATDLAVDDAVAADPTRLAVSQTPGASDNLNALAIAGLATQGMSGLGGLSLSSYWERHVETGALNLARAEQALEADSNVRSNLETQRESVSGVNVDEETINLMTYQRSYQASARFITVVDELMQTLLGLV